MSKNSFKKHAKSIKLLAKAMEINNSIMDKEISKRKSMIEEKFPGLLDDVVKMTKNHDVDGLLEKIEIIKKAEDASKRSNN